MDSGKLKFAARCTNACALEILPSLWPENYSELVILKVVGNVKEKDQRR